MRFKKGDQVKVIKGGSGCHPELIGAIVTIIEAKEKVYRGDAGYKVTPAIGNTLTGHFNGYIGEKTFKLHKPSTMNYQTIKRLSKCNTKT